jgi:hypothetical protein
VGEPPLVAVACREKLIIRNYIEDLGAAQRSARA